MKYIDVFPFSQVSGQLHFLLLRRAPDNSYPGIWQPVAGKIKAGETAWVAGLRELKEETGFIPRYFYALDHVSTYYLHETNQIIHVPAFLADVDHQEPILSHEHDAFQWQDLETTIRTASWAPYRKALSLIPELLSSSPALAQAKILLKNANN